MFCNEANPKHPGSKCPERRKVLKLTATSPEHLVRLEFKGIADASALEQAEKSWFFNVYKKAKSNLSSLIFSSNEEKKKSDDLGYKRFKMKKLRDSTAARLAIFYQTYIKGTQYERDGLSFPKFVRLVKAKEFDFDGDLSSPQGLDFIHNSLEKYAKINPKNGQIYFDTGAIIDRYGNLDPALAKQMASDMADLANAGVVDEYEDMQDEYEQRRDDDDRAAAWYDNEHDEFAFDNDGFGAEDMLTGYAKVMMSALAVPAVQHAPSAPQAVDTSLSTVAPTPTQVVVDSDVSVILIPPYTGLSEVLQGMKIGPDQKVFDFTTSDVHTTNFPSGSVLFIKDRSSVPAGFKVIGKFIPSLKKLRAKCRVMSNPGDCLHSAVTSREGLIQDAAPLLQWHAMLKLLGIAQTPMGFRPLTPKPALASVRFPYCKHCRDQRPDHLAKDCGFMPTTRSGMPSMRGLPRLNTRKVSYANAVRVAPTRGPLIVRQAPVKLTSAPTVTLDPVPLRPVGPVQLRSPELLAQDARSAVDASTPYTSTQKAASSGVFRTLTPTMYAKMVERESAMKQAIFKQWEKLKKQPRTATCSICNGVFSIAQFSDHTFKCKPVDLQLTSFDVAKAAASVVCLIDPASKFDRTGFFMNGKLWTTAHGGTFKQMAGAINMNVWNSQMSVHSTKVTAYGENDTCCYDLSVFYRTGDGAKALPFQPKSVKRSTQPVGENSLLTVVYRTVDSGMVKVEPVNIFGVDGHVIMGWTDGGLIVGASGAPAVDRNGNAVAVVSAITKGPAGRQVVLLTVLPAVNEAMPIASSGN